MTSPGPIDRRTFLAAAAATAALSSGGKALARRRQDVPRGKGQRPVVIASANGLETVARARDHILSGFDPLDAIVDGVAIVENDPSDMTVGYGGLPNEEGIVTLDSCVMHGPTHRAGAVASLENIKNPAQVAREVARRTDHVLLVGAGAQKFAKRLGFQEENLLTDEARRAWLRWRSEATRADDWLQADEFDLPTPQANPGAEQQSMGVDVDAQIDPTLHAHEGVWWKNGVPHTYGTIHCSAVTHTGDLAGCTTTSGLSWKLPGRVGDSPIIGAGNYTDNAIGSAGATGRGEAVIQICGAHTIVTRMGAGDHPTDACLYALQHIADRTRVRRLQDEQGRPNFNVVFYAVNKEGAYGSAAMWSGRRFAVADDKGARREDCALLYEQGS